MTDLTDLRDRIEDLLKDSGNADWSTAELDNALRLALSELSEAVPSLASTTVDAVADTWEYSLSAVTGLVRVVEAWYPYLASDAEYRKAHACKWRMLTPTTLMLDPASLEVDPDATYDIRVIYSKAQTIAGLDAETVTTVRGSEKSALVIGAAGFAALALSSDRYNRVNIGATTPVDLASWGKDRLAEFRGLVAGIAAMEGAALDPRAGPWPLDKWTGGG